MKKIIIGISGASGVRYGIRCVEILSQYAETHLIITEHAIQTILLETDIHIDSIKNMATFSYLNSDLSAAIASGSFMTDAMIILPCSIKTLSAIANSHNDTLLVRAADVIRKERKTLILGVREMPFHTGHLRIMSRLANDGVIICPPIPAFYGNPLTIGDLIDSVVVKYLDLLKIEHALGNRWNGAKSVINAH